MTCTFIRQPPFHYLSYKGTCHVILLAILHDMYLYMTATFPHQPSLFKACLRGGSLAQVSLYIQIVKTQISLKICSLTRDFTVHLQIFVTIWQKTARVLMGLSLYNYNYNPTGLHLLSTTRPVESKFKVI